MSEFTPRERVYVVVIMLMGLVCMGSVVWAVRSHLALQSLRARLGQADAGALAGPTDPSSPRQGLLSGIFGRPPTPLIVPRPRPRIPAKPLMPLKPLPSTFFAPGSRLTLRVTIGAFIAPPPRSYRSRLYGRRYRSRIRKVSLAHWQRASRWSASFRDSIHSVIFYRVKLDARSLSVLRHFPFLRRLQLHNGEVDAKGMSTIRLSALRSLHSHGVNDDLRWACHVDAPMINHAYIYSNPAIAEAGMRCLGKWKRLSSLHLNGCSGINDAAMKGLHGLVFLRTLYLNNLNVTGAGLRSLAGLYSLHSLYLQKMVHLTDAGLRHLSSLKHLTTLTLRHSLIDGSGLSHVKSPRLTTVHLQLSKLHLDGAKALASMRGLQSLSLNNTTMSQKAFLALGGSASLRYLNLNNSNFDDNAASTLSGMRSLRSLHLNKTMITDRGLKHLRGLASLRYLSLSGTGITNKSIASLLRLRMLYSLNVSRTSINRSGVRRLARMLRLRSLFVSARLSAYERHSLGRRYPRLRIYDY